MKYKSDPAARRQPGRNGRVRVGGLSRRGSRARRCSVVVVARVVARPRGQVHRQRPPLRVPRVTYVSAVAAAAAAESKSGPSEGRLVRRSLYIKLVPSGTVCDSCIRPSESEQQDNDDQGTFNSYS